MLIKKTLSEFKQAKQDPGYQAPDSEELQYQAVFSTKDLPLKSLFNANTQLPTEIKVRLHWRANKPDYQNIATLKVADHTYPPVRIYNSQAPYARSIDFIYDGYGRYVVNDESHLMHQAAPVQIPLVVNEVIYTFNFLTFAQNLSEHRIQQHGDKWLIVPSDRLDLTGINHIIFRGCGGWFGQGLSLGAMEQAYFAVTTDGASTQMNLKKQSELAATGLQPPINRYQDLQTFVFADPEPPRTPVHAITNGQMVIPVQYNDVIYQYRSIDYRAVNERDNLIEVTFIPLQ